MVMMIVIRMLTTIVWNMQWGWLWFGIENCDGTSMSKTFWSGIVAVQFFEREPQNWTRPSGCFVVKCVLLNHPYNGEVGQDESKSPNPVRKMLRFPTDAFPEADIFSNYFSNHLHPPCRFHHHDWSTFKSLTLNALSLSGSPELSSKSSSLSSSSSSSFAPMEDESSPMFESSRDKSDRPGLWNFTTLIGKLNLKKVQIRLGLSPNPHRPNLGLLLHSSLVYSHNYFLSEFVTYKYYYRVVFLTGPPIKS